MLEMMVLSKVSKCQQIYTNKCLYKGTEDGRYKICMVLQNQMETKFIAT